MTALRNKKRPPLAIEIIDALKKSMVNYSKKWAVHRADTDGEKWLHAFMALQSAHKMANNLRKQRNEK